MSGKRIAAAVALASFGVGLALAVCEVGFRLTGIAPVPLQYGDNVRDDAIGYRRRPGSSVVGRSESDEFDFRYTHNSLGFRDLDHDRSKPSGTRRIVAIGDSFTYGVGAAFDETYAAQLERRLNGRAGQPLPVEIVNLGLPRQFPLLERLTLEQYGWTFAPDLVLLAVLPNDLVDSERGRDAVCVADNGYLIPCAAREWSRAAMWLYLHSAVSRVVLHAWNRPQAGAADGQPHEGGWRAIEGEIGRIQEAARAHGALLVVVALPQRPPWKEEDAAFETRLGQWCAANGVEFIPTLAAMRAAAPAQLYWPRDGHCTPAGYAVVAETVAAALDARGLVP